MPKPPKPYFKKQSQRWVCTIQGRRITLGKTKKEADEKFHSLMADQESVSSEVTSLYDLSQVYLEWCESHRKESTFNKHKHYLESFINSVGRTLRISSLKKLHITKWTDKETWNSTTQNDAIRTVQRMLNWSVEEGYINKSPISSIQKPRAKSRDVFYTADQWKEIRSHATGPFLDLIDFLYETGCRPLEARTLEARHVLLNHDVCMFPADESKGEEAGRVIYLTEKSKQILKRLITDDSEGPIFLNTRGIPWTKDSIKCRLTKISEKVGFSVVAYGIRHTWATDALLNGSDSVVVAELMGHRDTTMVSKVYQKLARNPEFLKDQAKRIRSTSS